MPDSQATSFAALDLPSALQDALADVGYESPSPIQAATIPAMLAGRDVLGQAQTGTGKTAAFALPVLARLAPEKAYPQALVLAPTRELAIQVAEAFQKYAARLPGFRVLPVYGGADYRSQLKQLKRGAAVVVGTPGRVMDHMRRGTLDISRLQTLVLDEADEMLRMGFIDDVEWILEQTPGERQIALFSATMPEAIRRVARRHLRDPQEVSIAIKAVSHATIRQRVWIMSGVHKLDALTRMLEVEPIDAAIVFVRTRLATTELAEKLAARGHSAAALNGDIPQKQREATLDRLRSGAVDILVATDVAARGLDVERITHVINYDIPSDVEAYVHRIGRTGRAGRKGDAILFAAPRERRLLRALERATGGSIEAMDLPSAGDVANRRIADFKARITDTLATRDLDTYRALVTDYQREYGVPLADVAAAVAALVDGRGGMERAPAADEPSPDARKRKNLESHAAASKGRRPRPGGVDAGMERFRIAVGHKHGAKPGHIVGAIANEADLDAEHIGYIDIRDTYSLVDLPAGMPDDVFRLLQNVRVSGQKLQISRQADRQGGTERPRRRKPPAKRS
jgi:ATP-dependent RNA helicase DeaD